MAESLKRIEELLEGSNVSVHYEANQGRFVTAARDADGGDVILASEPYYWCVLPGFFSKCCDYCMSVGEKSNEGQHRKLSLKCAACGYVAYCSVACQSKAKELDIHSDLECQMFRLFQSRDDPKIDHDQWDLVAMGIRALALLYGKQSGDGSVPRKSNHSLSPGDFDLLVDNLSWLNEEKAKFFSDPAEWMVENLLKPLGSNSPLASIDEKRMGQILSKISCNNFGRWISEDDCPACAVIVQASFFNHSCVPNIKTSYEGRSQKIRSVYPLKKGDSLSLGYIDIMKSREERIKTLEREYFFRCQCQRCSDNTPVEKRERYDRFVTQFCCSKCSTVLLPKAPRSHSYHCLQCGFEKEIKSLSIDSM